MFADDTKVLRHITKYEDALELQDDLNRMQLWSVKWLLKFNPSKCKVISLGALENIVYAHQYHICGEVLEHVDVENDLGVTIDSALKFEQHILNKIKIANSMMGLIRRVFSYLSPEIFKPLYSALVRSHLEYAQAVRSPRYKRMQDMIEQVQIRATKQVDGLQHLDYPERLKLLNLPTLKYRRHRGDMIETWKHFSTYEEQLLPPSFTPRDRPSRRHRRHCTSTTQRMVYMEYNVTASTSGQQVYGTNFQQRSLKLLR
ncbi:hypothetical protein Pcinc_005335 [Petrolisthes cinctipes]|uniref:Reverse transcriptase domain-containing protein n=1 Tax=Petrolisthes cinctipes TaxID=88211 RepID=A0AAE1GFC6_PETCI|nr:hypothetical protein Pcinc_005335 [Petrolisthes cinctipes]